MVGLAVIGIAGPAAAQDASPMASMPAASMAPASMAPGSMVPADSTIAVALADFTVMPMVIDAVGPTVTFDVSNAGPTPHNLTIRDDAGTVLGATDNLSTGDSAVLTVTFPGPGTYITYCSLPGHESLGLKGTLVVTDASPMGSPAASPAASPAS